MVAEGKVHGGTSFFQRINPFSGHRAVAPLANKDERRVDAQAQGAVSDRPPLLERRSNVPLDSDDAQAEGDSSPFTNGAPQPDAPTNFGYSRTLDRRFRVKQELARGGNGVVSLVENLETGQEWAMKSIPKVLTDPNLSDK